MIAVPGTRCSYL